MRTMIAGLMIGLALMVAGCASIVSGTTQRVTFQSIPDEALVTLDELVSNMQKRNGLRFIKSAARVMGKTPFTGQLEREDERSVTFSKDGYQSVTVKLTTVTNGAFWGNILSGGIPGSSTDTVSGAIHEYEPSHYMVSLVPLQSSAIEAPTLYSQRDKVRAFVLMRYASIMADLSTGTGEDLSALLTLLHIDKTRQPEAQRVLHAMAQGQPDRAAFATTVAERYMK